MSPSWAVEIPPQTLATTCLRLAKASSDKKPMVSLIHVAIYQKNVSIQQERMPQAFGKADTCCRAVTPREE